LSEDLEHRRPVRSYVRREGRMTEAQRRALEALWPRYGVEPEDVLDFDALFGRQAPRVLEIGFGMGDALAEMAAHHPEQDYLGIEVHRPGVGSLLRKLDAAGLTNVRVLSADASEVLVRCIPEASLDVILIFFPDPWPKKRHHKRRLIQPELARRLARAVKPGGVLHLATDWEDYARQMIEVLDGEPALENVAGPGGCVQRPDYRPITKFERRGARLGHGVWDVMYRRTESEF
jgi:tRNA (guanine-N7-)-methyltransferase